MSTTTAPVGNDATLAEAIMYAEYILRALRDARDDNGAGHYPLANARLAAVRATIPGLMERLDTVHADLVWRVR